MIARQYLPKTGKGRALLTTCWFLYGFQPFGTYDTMTFESIRWVVSAGIRPTYHPLINGWEY